MKGKLTSGQVPIRLHVRVGEDNTILRARVRVRLVLECKYLTISPHTHLSTIKVRRYYIGAFDVCNAGVYRAGNNMVPVILLVHAQYIGNTVSSKKAELTSACASCKVLGEVSCTIL